MTGIIDSITESSQTEMVDTMTEIINSITQSSQTKTIMTTAAKFTNATSKSIIGSLVFILIFQCFLYSPGATPPLQFVAPNCDTSATIASTCAKLKSPCEMFKPCLNNGTCCDNDTSPTGYSCSCLRYYNGTNCQSDHQPCKLDTCWNNGRRKLPLLYQNMSSTRFFSSVLQGHV